jgi:hypothetical protein
VSVKQEKRLLEFQLGMKFLRLVLLVSSTSRPSKAHYCTTFVSSMVTTRRALTTTTKRAAKESPVLPSKKPAKRKASSSSSKKNITANEELSANVEENPPWYRLFTKGDEEYDRYMASEWGFEKVRIGPTIFFKFPEA